MNELSFCWEAILNDYILSISDIISVFNGDSHYHTSSTA
jgi:hypothetical protein